jgi:hypothetical protein
MKEHLNKIRVLKKPVSEETRALLRSIALNRQPITNETRKKMSINNNKSVKIIVYFADTNLVYREFLSIADVASHFFNDRNRRGPIKYALQNNTKFLKKYYLCKSNTDNN